MATTISKLDTYKLETRFGDGFVENSNFEWMFSTRQPTGSTKWKRERLLGAGGFGSVWLERESGGQLRAVKTIQRHVILETGFSQELLALITLIEHSYLFVQFFGWYENEHEIFLAMEYIEHGDLSGYMKDQQKAKANAGEITKQILEGLQVLHQEGICHRDLKPQNILVASHDPLWVKIADFGASKRSRNTALRTQCGTLGYIAPELLGVLPREFRTGDQFTYALDMWSLGCLVHELLTSERPFSDSGGDIISEISGFDTTTEPFEPSVDMTRLFEYCHGRAEFPTSVLQSSQVTRKGIDLVLSLLVADPKARATATSALQSPWLIDLGYTSDWYKRLEREFSDLGLDLDLGNRYDRSLMRQIHTVDIVRFLPAIAVNHLPALLVQAFERKLHTAASMLLSSPTRILKDPSGVQKLFDYAVEGRRSGWVKRLLQTSGINVNHVRDDGATALEIAVHNGWYDIVCMLLTNGATVNTEAGLMRGGRTVLQIAAGRGDIDLTTLLLDMKADINAGPVPKFGRTALQAAAESGHINLVKFLYEKEAKIDAEPAPTGGRTALQAAAGSGHIDVAVFLLDNGADVNYRPSKVHGRTALQAAAGSGQIDLVKLLLDRDADISDSQGDRTAVQAAAESGHLDVVRLLLDSQANINDGPAEDNGRTALQAAAGSGHVEMVKFLLDNDAKINGKPASKAGRTALQAAAESGHLNVVKLLLESKAHVNAKSAYNYGRTALQAAAERGHMEVAKFLLEKMARVNCSPSDIGGRTALQAAAGGGHIEMVKLLLDNKAKVNAKAASGFGRTVLQAAAEMGWIEIVQLLLDDMADVNAKPGIRYGLTALQAAAGRGHIDVVQLLLGAKAEVNAKAAYEGGRTALQSAADGNHLAVVDLLKANGAIEVHGAIEANNDANSLERYEMSRGALDIFRYPTKLTYAIIWLLVVVTSSLGIIVAAAYILPRL